MIIAGLSIVLGILIGLASGGKLPALRELSLRFEALIVVLFLGQALARGRLFPGVEANRFGIPVWVAVSSVLVVVLMMNAARPGVVLASAGMLLNMIVVMLNGAMPLSALPEGFDAAAEIGASGGFYAFADTGTLLPVIADAMPLILGRTTLMMSVGDVAIGVGVITIIVGAMLGESGQGKTSRNGLYGFRTVGRTEYACATQDHAGGSHGACFANGAGGNPSVLCATSPTERRAVRR